MKASFPFFAVSVACVLAAVSPRTQAADPYQQLATWQFGQSREPLALIDEAIRQSAPNGYAAIEAKLLPVLQSATTPKDAKRFICRWLAVVGSEQCVPAVAALLPDADLSHLARFALEPLPNAAAGAALREALPKVNGPLLAGVMASLGVRRDAQAVGPLGNLAKHNDALIAETAIEALGEIGTAAAAKMLASLPDVAALSRVIARARLTAAAHLVAAGNRGLAAGTYRSLVAGGQPQFIRIAALNGLISALPRNETVPLVLDTLQGDDVAMRNACVSAYASSTDAAMQNAVAAALPDLKPAGQILLLGMLADLPEVAARSAALKVLESSSDLDVRVAALKCLQRHGEPSDVPMLVKLAQNPTAALAGAARDTLQQMTHAGVDATLIALIESPAAGDRAVVLASLGARRVTSALPTLARLVQGTDATLAVEAAKALEIMGQTEQLTALAAVMVRTENAALRSAAAAAAQAICRRAPDKPAAAQPLVAALAEAQSNAARQALLPLLVITGGNDALQAVQQATRDSHADVRDTAIRALVAWPQLEAAPLMLALARTTSNPTYAILALRDGCLRLAQMEDWPMARRLELYRNVLGLARRPEEKKQAISGLAQLPSLGALELLQTCAQEAPLQSDAILAVTRLARQLGAVYHQQTLAALQQLQSRAPTDDLRKQVAQALKAVQNVGQSPEGYIVAWLLSGPYTQEGKDGAGLFDVPFAPEKSIGQAEWRPAAATPGHQNGLVEMDKIFGGQDRVAYLRTTITSEQAQEALLEMGSDDGLKVWLNGTVVLANNATRPASPGQDKAKIKLKQGANELLLKITQGGGEWSACCRLRAPDGKALDNVTVAPGAQ